jgi:hypothetical protein
MLADVSEKHITSIFRVENQQSKKLVCSRWLGKMALRYSETSVHIRTTLCCIPEDGSIYNSCYHHYNNIWRRVQIMNLRNTQFSSPSYCVPPYRPKYSSLYLFLENHRPVSLIQRELSKFKQNRSKEVRISYSFVILLSMDW